MANERLKADAAMALEALEDQLSGIAELQRRRMALTGTAFACDKRIRVTVNAAGVLVDTQFADDIDELSYEEIAAAMTSAVQSAAADVERQADELMRPLLEARAKLPKLSDIFDGAPDFGAPASLAPHDGSKPPSPVPLADPRWSGSLVTESD
ncbi:MULTISPECIES: YbaB/EbfC family nucleoid-associated protein [unclassified Nocardia]|uniref:YbaB/EbfC family nucleoid-associated protein n=1 Tax=unclassified Nocardia TaxID=2637762 RepID=UPI001CE401D4|nr:MULTISPECIES: YbaB/EbfC family nucleoid-associated protein [unclassified Nocardia]